MQSWTFDGLRAGHLEDGFLVREVRNLGIKVMGVGRLFGGFGQGLRSQILECFLFHVGCWSCDLRLVILSSEYIEGSMFSGLLCYLRNLFFMLAA